MFRDLRQLSRFLLHVARRFNEDRCLQIASSLTFTTLLALVPLVTIALALISAFPVFTGVGEQIRDFLVANMLPDKAGRVITAYIEQFSGRAGQLTAVGMAALAITAFMTMFTIEQAFNSIWRVLRRRPVVQRILMYWAVLTLGPILIGASLSITSFVIGASLGVARQVPLAEEVILRLVPSVLTCAAFTLLYYVVPNRPVEPRHALVGGLLAAAAFEFMKRGFAAYIAQFPTYTLVYGAFAAIPIFLLWVYFSWVVIVAGALITALAPDFGVLRESTGRAPGTGFEEALALLLVLAQAQRVPEVLELRHIAQRVALTNHRAESLLERMASLGWLARSAGDRYVLAYDPEKLRVADVYRQFVLGGKKSAIAEGNAALDGLLERLAAQADGTLDLSVRKLLESEGG
jgi:membrane protein